MEGRRGVGDRPPVDGPPGLGSGSRPLPVVPVLRKRSENLPTDLVVQLHKLRRLDVGGGEARVLDGALQVLLQLPAPLLQAR
eukprot:757110-Hanusia_phi.AAC.1